MKENLCIICGNSEVTIEKGTRPAYANSWRMIECNRLSIWCKEHCNRPSWKTKCKNYRPKAGKLNKHAVQNTL